MVLLSPAVDPETTLGISSAVLVVAIVFPAL